jgi:cysteine desulfurase
VFAVSHDRKNALCSWRISLSHHTTQADLEEFLQIFHQCYELLTHKEVTP